MAFFIIITLLTVAVLVDVLTRPETQIRHLPKMAWFILVLLFPIVGGLVWLLVGREWAPLPEYKPLGDPSRSAPEPTFTTTEQELAALDAEIAFHEKQARLARLEAEVAEKRRKRTGGS
jgi:hypothetical protein